MAGSMVGIFPKRAVKPAQRFWHGVRPQRNHAHLIVQVRIMRRLLHPNGGDQPDEIGVILDGLKSCLLFSEFVLLAVPLQTEDELLLRGIIVRL